MAYHRPVLLNESIQGLDIKPKGVYIDLTFGGGGHARRILEQLGRKGRLLAFDQDPDAKVNLPDDKRLIFIHANFRYLKNFLRYYEIEAVDGVLADLGISSHQIDEPDRGFSFRADATLDMRMNPASGNSAERVLNDYDESDLRMVLKQYGELKNAGRIANCIAEARSEKRIKTTVQLADIIKDLAPRDRQAKFFAKVYQAVRIEVNDEITALKEMLGQTPNCMREGGRLVVITYHSIEDRLVKNFMKSGNVAGKMEKDFYGNLMTPWRLVNRSVIVPGENEILENRRARSAKLRVSERVGEWRV
ncbi:MAG TPA: 16S rRNA (cytosine(1402)-N(4))-methyltransferase RsmH [Bacteroidales bacterium]|nr:16S rRNA (cytosine(1402)-N(4))-methyltransferase RsmH [Bacteroidales bacterium]